MRRVLPFALVLGLSATAFAQPAAPAPAPPAAPSGPAAATGSGPSTPPAGASAPPAAPGSAATGPAAPSVTPPVTPSAPPSPPVTPAPSEPAAPAAAPPAISPDDVAAPTNVVTPYGESPYYAVKTTRRYGFTFGAVTGLALHQASGSQVKFTLRDQAIDTGIAAGQSTTLFLGGVLTDWFAFHLGVTFGSSAHGDYKLAGTAFVFGLSTWPLFRYGGIFRDLGIGADFGTGSATVKSKASGQILADGGGMSMVRGNVFWDAIAFGKFSFGPYVSYERRDAETYSENIGLLGARLVFYGVQER